MMKKLLFIFTLLLFPTGKQLWAQTVTAPEGEKLLRTAPKEKIFVHFNTSLLFPGEYLYYKIYNINASTNTPSDISKVAYVELVGENGEQVFQHLVNLTHGQGHGDFFIPTSLPSGSYKLLGYTNWMRNTNQFFQADLVVINPYRGDQSAVTSKNEIPDSTGFFVAPAQIASNSESIKTASAVELDIAKEEYGPREQVNLNIESSSGKALTGIYSVSVRRIDSIRNPDKPDPGNILGKSDAGKDDGPVYLPEFRGTLISGKIEPLASAGGRSPEYVKIAFSIPGEEILYKVATTNKRGEFFLSFDEPRTSPEMFVQIIGEDRNFFEIRLDKQPSVDLSDLSFAEFSINPAMEEWILERSVQNQIENAYYSQKPDTVVTAPVKLPFYVQKPELYILDAYNRFQSIEETFVEIIQSAWISKNSEGEEMIVVREPNGGTEYDLPALLLVDGVMIQDHANFISYPAKNVVSIGILRDNYYIGSHIFEGIIDVRTFNGRYWEENPEDYLLQKELKIPEPQKNYFQQTYSDSTQQRTNTLPDLRTQLLWKPELVLSEGEEAAIEFYTSDVTGYYEIELNGFTNQGTPVSHKEYFRVEE